MQLSFLWLLMRLGIFIINWFEFSFILIVHFGLFQGGGSVYEWINISATIFPWTSDNFLNLGEVRSSQEYKCLHCEYPKATEHGDNEVNMRYLFKSCGTWQEEQWNNSSHQKTEELAEELSSLFSPRSFPHTSPPPLILYFSILSYNRLCTWMFSTNLYWEMSFSSVFLVSSRKHREYHKYNKC